MSRKLNSDVNVDGRTNARTNGNLNPTCDKIYQIVSSEKFHFYNHKIVCIFRNDFFLYFHCSVFNYSIYGNYDDVCVRACRMHVRAVAYIPAVYVYSVLRRGKTKITMVNYENLILFQCSFLVHIIYDHHKMLLYTRKWSDLRIPKATDLTTSQCSIC